MAFSVSSDGRGLAKVCSVLVQGRGGCRLDCREEAGKMLSSTLALWVCFSFFFFLSVFKNVLEEFQVVRKGNQTRGKEKTLCHKTTTGKSWAFVTKGVEQ